MFISTTSTLPILAQHFIDAAERLERELDKAVRDVARDGQRTARRYANRSAGSHGKHYPSAITVERLGIADFVYGPESGLPQGGMSFEHGSRNQPPHLDLARSADGIKAKLGPKIDRAIEKALR